MLKQENHQIVAVALLFYCYKAFVAQGPIFACITAVSVYLLASLLGLLKDVNLKLGIQYIAPIIATSIWLAFTYYLFKHESILLALISSLLFGVLLDAADLGWGKRRPFSWFLFVIILFRTTLFDVMYVPSESMTPTLLHGDFVLVKKCEYGLNKESLWPFAKILPILPTIEYKKPKAGDIVVWTREQDSGFTYYVKRAVAVSKDTLQMKAGILHLNNIPSSLEALEHSYYIRDDGLQKMVYQYKETQADGTVKVIIRDAPLGDGYKDDTSILQIPENHFAIVGDNRTGSNYHRGGSFDSRSTFFFPPMPYSQIIGAPKLVLISSSGWSKHINPKASWGSWIINFPLLLADMIYNIRGDRFLKPVHNSLSSIA